MQASCDKKAFDTVIHPIPKCVVFLEDLLQDMVDKKSKDPFGTIRVARKALSRLGAVLRSPGRHSGCVCLVAAKLDPLPGAITGNCKEVCHPPMVNSSARRPSSDLPAAKHLQLPQKLV